MNKPCLLIGDIGGTNARFALAKPDGTGFFAEKTLACADYETAENAISAFLDQAGQPQPEVICLAVAGPIVDGCVRFTNNDWSIDCRDLQQSFPAASVRLLNDFEAIACSIPLLDETDIETIGLRDIDLDHESDYTIGILGSGTGLGVAGLMAREGATVPIVGEGSHAGFAPESQLQLKVLEQLRDRFERVSDERLLSGPGLENIYWALRRIHGKRGASLSAPEIFRRAMDNSDVHAAEALQLFYEVLGQAAGNLALLLGAWDGIYIAGGIVKRYPELIRTSRFRSGFENKGRHRSLMETVPTVLILHPEPGLLGASYCACKALPLSAR